MRIRHILPPSILLLAVTFSGCRKEPDTPPLRTLPVGSVFNVKQLRGWYANEFSFLPHTFSGDSSVYAVVTADEVNGNLYKNVFVQDDSAAIQLRLQNSGGLYVGDRIRIYLKGTVLSSYNGMLQLDSVDVDNNIVKQQTLVPITPLDVSVTDVTPAIQGQLVRLNEVEFIDSEAASMTWSDPVGQTTQNRTLKDCSGNTVIVRTSGYANFAGQPLPQGKGSLVAVVGQFGSTMQLYVRRMNEVQMNGPRCSGASLPLLSKDFEDNSITSGGWTQQNVLASVPWTSFFFGGERFARITNFSSGVNTACETWYISPPVNLSGTTAPVLTFRTACNFSGPDLETLVSMDYDGTSAPGTATWTPLSHPLSTGGYVWVQSGELDLSPFIGPSFHLAYRYTGTNSSGKTWEVDDILIVDSN